MRHLLLSFYFLVGCADEPEWVCKQARHSEGDCIEPPDAGPPVDGTCEVDETPAASCPTDEPLYECGHAHEGYLFTCVDGQVSAQDLFYRVWCECGETESVCSSTPAAARPVHTCALGCRETQVEIDEESYDDFDPDSLCANGCMLRPELPEICPPEPLVGCGADDLGFDYRCEAGVVYQHDLSQSRFCRCDDSLACTVGSPEIAVHTCEHGCRSAEVVHAEDPLDVTSFCDVPADAGP
jgi:hypothetical protein